MRDDYTKYELTDEQYEQILPYLPSSEGRRGRPWNDHRNIINGILFRTRHGCGWRAVPREYGPWKTIAGRFATWSKDGTWAFIFEMLTLEVLQSEPVEQELWMIDGTIVRAHKAAAGARKDSKKESRKSLMTMHLDSAEAVGAPSSMSCAPRLG